MIDIAQEATFLNRRRALTLIGTAAGSLVLGGCSESEAQNASGSVSVDKLMAEPPLDEKIEGSSDAAVTIIEYASMTCPHCATFHEKTYPTIKEKYVDTGKIKFILREFPFDNLALAAFMLARCAPNDGYFPMVDILFQRQRNWSRSENPRQALFDIARLAGFTQKSFESCLTDQSLLEGINKVRNKGAQEFGVDATPTFFINGTKYSGGMSVDEMSGIIDKLL